MRFVACALLLAAAARAESVADLARRVRENLAARRPDAEIAAVVRDLKLTDRLDDAVIEALESEGSGRLTVEELERQRDLSEKLPPSPFQLDAQPAPDAGERAKIVDHARVIALQYNDGLPNFLCTETVRRFDDKKGGEAWKAADILVVEVAYTGKQERYRLVTVNGQPATKSLNAMGGFKSTGEFGSLQRLIFEPKSQTRFEWQRWSNLRGRPAHVFAFHIDQKTSEYLLNFRTGVLKRYRMIAAMTGLVYLDRDSHKVMRIRVDAEGIPSNWPILRTPSVLDYDYAEVGGQQYLLPVRADLRVISRTAHSRNVMEFGKYRRFTGEATVNFDKQ